MKSTNLTILIIAITIILCSCSQNDLETGTHSNSEGIEEPNNTIADENSIIDEKSYEAEKKLVKDIMLSFGTNTTAYGTFDYSTVFDFSNDGKSENNPNMYMAHNIYSDPDLSNTSGKFDGFIIDFKSDHVARGTYWALCNWEMDLTSLQKSYPSATGGSAYCGLQNTNNGLKAIMSFWDIECGNTVITASLEYPTKDGNGLFDNEGSGANYITDYNWKESKWYRLYLHCFEDEQSGHTFVEMWIMDLESGLLDKICCYDTKLSDSYFTGGISQFMENYDYLYCSDVRSFQYANLNVLDHETQEWTHITNSTLSIDTWYGNKKGTYAFGSSESFLWGIVCGYGEDSAAPNSDIHSNEFIR